MMSTTSKITVLLRDGTKRDYPQKSGHLHNKIWRYEAGFFIVIDEFGNETAIPRDLISEIKIRWK